MLVTSTVLPARFGTFGCFYLVAARRSAAALRARLAAVARELAGPGRVLFHFSLLYLALLFLAVAIDAAVR